MKGWGLTGLLRRSNQFIISLGNQLSWLYLLIVGISVYEVLMRYAFGRPTTWVHESSLSLAGMLMIYGGLYVFAQGRHIAVSVLTDLLPAKLRHWLSLLADLITLLYIGLLTISALLMTKEAVFAPDGSLQLERSGSSWNSVFPGVVKVVMSLFLLLFLCLVLIHALAKGVAMWQGRRGGDGGC